MRKILFITGSRSEYYLQKPLLEAVRKHPDLEEVLVITGSHLKKGYGNTLKEILSDSEKGIYKISSELDNRAQAIGSQLDELFAVVITEHPDIIVAPYDREESMSAALTGVYNNIPVVHLGAGERTEANVDRFIRGAVSKLSEVLLTTSEENRDELIKQGHKTNRVRNVGHLALDRYHITPIFDIKKMERFLEIKLDEPLIVFIMHPVSEELEYAYENAYIALNAVSKMGLPTVIIHPNSDDGRDDIVRAINAYKHHKHIRVFENVPDEYFVNLMRHASVLVGNSSAGILESPIVNLPVVNVGSRQTGRQTAGNVMFVDYDFNEIFEAIDESINEDIEFEQNPYGDGHTAERIVDILCRMPI